MAPVTVNVPEVLNGESLRAFRAALDRAFMDRAARVIILRGSDECFCRGMDLAAACSGPVSEADISEFADCLDVIHAGPKPVLAWVRGNAGAGGVGIAAAADLVIADPQASFVLTELLFGLLPAVILPYLLRRIAPSRARSWALAAETWSAARARSEGLVDVVAQTNPERAVSASVRRLGRTDPEAAALWKRYTAEPGPFDPRRGVEITAARLRDPRVIARLRSFIQEGEIPWPETP